MTMEVSGLVLVRRAAACLLLSSLVFTSRLADAQVASPGFQEPDGQRRDQTFRVLSFENSNIHQTYPGTLRYYCTFRGKWSKSRQPVDFPKSASWSQPVMIAHSNGYRMWSGTETATLGVESIAEEGFATVITNEFTNAGSETKHLVIGDRLFNTSDSQHLPPINVTYTHPFMSAMVKMIPSPDWFAGFSDWRTINPSTETFYKRIVIQSFPWDCGTDDGKTYTALDRDLDPQRTIARITKTNVPPNGQFLDPQRSYVPIVAEFECKLRVGEDGEPDPGTGLPWNETEFRLPLYEVRDDDIMPDGRTRFDHERDQKRKDAGGSGAAGIALKGRGMAVMTSVVFVTTWLTTALW
uniref:Spondin domain-containing protein n=1 Tax=Craspedostauros australis TaxID=1486917 RepID=A0A7R9ZLK4_9STRA|mmetsp:Transcript_1632/g.4474  ORF Transcript_1632/g.4474 Transcript_1632/m.4474 type:complete len:353 (+) Transcript_1632:160-1218(+)